MERKEKEERETTREEKFCDDHSFGDRDGTRPRLVELCLCFALIFSKSLFSYVSYIFHANP